MVSNNRSELLLTMNVKDDHRVKSLFRLIFHSSNTVYALLHDDSILNTHHF